MQAKKIRLLFKHADQGFNRRYYKDVDVRARSGGSVYCATDVDNCTVMYACSKDGEPSHVVTEYEIVFN